MSLFADAQTRAKTSVSARLSTRRPLVVFVLCLVVGLGVVAWRAKGRAQTARAVACTEARARGAALELQFSQVATAAEALGMLARHGRGGVTNFQKVATELLTARSGLASLELQPGGVVSDIVPRAGHERALGFNVLKDPAQRVSANAAIARRMLTVACPVTLGDGAQGIVARVALFQRTRDGRESFWGFVAASMRLQEALSRAQMGDLSRQGYDFAFYAPASGQLKTTVLAWSGLSSPQDAVLQPIRSQNLELRLALKPRGGWIDRAKVVLESLAVLLVSLFMLLSVSLLENRRAVEAELREATRRLARDAADLSQTQTECREAKERAATAQAQLVQTQLLLQQAESNAAELQSRSEACVLARDEAAQVTEANQAELKKAHAALHMAQETIQRLQARLDAAVQAEKDAALAAQERLQHSQEVVVELQGRLESATRSARETSETKAIEVAQTEPSNREVEERPIAAEQAQAHVTEMHGPPQKTQEEPKKALEAPVEVAPLVKPSATQKAVKSAKRKPVRRDDQLHLFGSEALAIPPTSQRVAEAEARVREAREPKTPATENAAPSEVPTRRLPPAPPVEMAQLRKAVNQILPLVAERDPGAKDCLRDNRTTFRSAFAPEAFVEFEQLVKSGDFEAALEQLKKAARKHGISL